MQYAFDSNYANYLPDIDNLMTQDERSRFVGDYTSIPPLNIPEMTKQIFDGGSNSWIEILEPQASQMLLDSMASRKQQRLIELRSYEQYYLNWIAYGIEIPEQVLTDKNVTFSAFDKYFKLIDPNYENPEGDIVKFSRTISEIISVNKSSYQHNKLKGAEIIHLVYLNSLPIQMPVFVKETGTLTGLSVSVDDKITVIFN